uniref:Mannitol 1-phosphate dehydrogenase n=1 Tax=Ganoderma boninense TaxID=34458 RepID=A0A5K1JX29_9APHY|nr:Mannitol 1-phosphate dehydrogenase [Ganoderma boninense]
MSQASQKDFKVTVIGGGVCGLACAIALQKAGITVDLFEAAAAFGEVGASIGLGPNAVRALKELSLVDAVLAKLSPGDYSSKGILMYSGIGNHELIYDFKAAPEDASISMHRAAFLDALVGLVDPSSTHFSKRCTSISESSSSPGRLVVSFADGTSHETDVVIGADGLKSVVRDFVVAKDPPGTAVAFSNTAIYRGLIPFAQLQAAGFRTTLGHRPACFLGPSKHVIVVPIKGGQLINVAASVARYDVPIGSASLPPGTPWVGEASTSDIQQDFEGWGPDVAALLRCMPAKTGRWSIHVVHPELAAFSREHVAILGDAAVLEAYSAIRRPRSKQVWDASQKAGAAFDHQGPHGTTSEGLLEDLQGMWDPVGGYDLDAEFAAAVTLLEVSKSVV